MFCKRDLTGYDVVYLIVDGVCESLRLEAGLKEALLCAWAILSNGRKVKMSEYDLAILRNIRHLYGWKDKDDGYISKEIAA